MVRGEQMVSIKSRNRTPQTLDAALTDAKTRRARRRLSAESGAAATAEARSSSVLVPQSKNAMDTLQCLTFFSHSQVHRPEFSPWSVR